MVKSLLRLGFDTETIALIANVDENDVWAYIEEERRQLNAHDKLRNESAVRDEARTWAEQLPEAFETKRTILLERLRNASSDIEKQQRLTHYKIFTGKIATISVEEKERARNFPLKDLIGTHKDITQCPFHDDRTASLNIKNNFFYCHGCGVSGDTIDFLMKRDGLTFPQAVAQLQ